MNARVLPLLLGLAGLGACDAADDVDAPVFEVVADGKADGFTTPRFEVPGRHVARLDLSSNSGYVRATVVDSSPKKATKLLAYALPEGMGCEDEIGDEGQTALTPVAESDFVVDPALEHQGAEATQYCIVIDNANSIGISLEVSLRTDAPPPPPPPRPCCEAHDGQGCDDETCEAAVCEADDFCCSNSWDDLCAETAQGTCFETCGTEPPPPPPGPCCEANDGAGCEVQACQDIVCAEDAFCCDDAWDRSCADKANALCADPGAACGPPLPRPCCEQHDGQGCDDETCSAAICEADAFCCDTQWDSLCAGDAADSCEVCAEPDPEPEPEPEPDPEPDPDPDPEPDPE